MIRGGAPGAILLVGPAGVGKTTLAIDLAAGLLCRNDDPAARPCGACRSCRLVAHASHPDLHLLGPEGAGRQVVIGGPGSKVRGVRDLISELALLPVEGGARVAIIESAHRLNEDAQAALLKTLEEPPRDTTIVLCADAEEPLLPTIRSRSARIRLGPVGVRDIEAILAESSAADPPVAARAARISGGRPGIALAWVAHPDALRERDSIGRTLIDLIRAKPADRLAGVRALGASATTISGIGDGRPLDVASEPEEDDGSSGGKDRRARGKLAASEATSVEAGSSDDIDAESGAGPARAPAAERRRAAEALISLWTDLARDVALCQRGLDRSVRDLALLDDIQGAAIDLDAEAVRAFIERLGRAAVLIAGNSSPELVLDDLALAWPRPVSSSRAA